VPVNQVHATRAEQPHGGIHLGLVDLAAEIEDGRAMHGGRGGGKRAHGQIVRPLEKATGAQNPDSG
jgi:hypothetical protein